MSPERSNRSPFDKLGVNGSCLTEQHSRHVKFSVNKCSILS